MSCNSGSGCCASCGTLGDFPGHSIPYALNASEIGSFLANNQSNAVLSSYIQDSLEAGASSPPQGVIVNESYGTLLVWYDAGMNLHVIDVTNMNIVHEVQKVDFESPDSSIVQDVVSQIKTLVSSVGFAVEGVAIVVGLVALGYLIFKAS